MYVDLSRSMKRLMDGHCMYYDFCYDGLFQTYLPIPLVLLTNEQGEQAVHIAPEAFEVASTEFGDQISVWQDALPGSRKGNLESVRIMIWAALHNILYAVHFLAFRS